MRVINHYSHISFVHTRLTNIAHKDSFIHKIKKTVGNYIGSSFEASIYENHDYPEPSPVRALFDWIVYSGGVTLSDLQEEDGDLIDDSGNAIHKQDQRSISGVEQMAAFGLWFIDCELGIMGPAAEEDYDENRISPYGWTEASVIDHRAECLLNSYQALFYAERLIGNVNLSEEETKRIATFDFSKLGKKGADKRHAPMRALQEWTLERYRAGSWPSANQAAHELMISVMEHGRTINAVLLPSNAQRTIAAWINKAPS